MTWINRIHSFVHIRGSITFLVWLFYYTNTRNRIDESQSGKNIGKMKSSPAGLRLYESRRRTIAFSNLLAFIIFTIWPCMPLRLLSPDRSQGKAGQLARSYGRVPFPDHLVPITNLSQLCRYSAWSGWRRFHLDRQPLHQQIRRNVLSSLRLHPPNRRDGVTIATTPLNPAYSSTESFVLPFFNHPHPKFAPKITIPSWRRGTCLIINFMYPTIILMAIIVTANHFILDAVTRSIMCGLARWGNDVLLNLLALEDWFLWFVRIYKLETVVVDVDGDKRQR